MWPCDMCQVTLGPWALVPYLGFCGENLMIFVKLKMLGETPKLRYPSSVASFPSLEASSFPSLPRISASQVTFIASNATKVTCCGIIPIMPAANLWKNEMHPGVHVHLRQRRQFCSAVASHIWVAATFATLVALAKQAKCAQQQHHSHSLQITSEHFWTSILASTAPCHLCRPSFPFHHQMASLNKMDGCVFEALVYIQRFVVSALLPVNLDTCYSVSESFKTHLFLRQATSSAGGASPVVLHASLQGPHKAACPWWPESFHHSPCTPLRSGCKNMPTLRCISVTALVASSGDAKHTNPKPWRTADPKKHNKHRFILHGNPLSASTRQIEIPLDSLPSTQRWRQGLTFAIAVHWDGRRCNGAKLFKELLAFVPQN